MKPDYFGECFDPKGGMTQEQFGQTFCRVCLNPECSRSSVDGSSWAQRIATQEERLLIRPKFADPDDPQYRDIARLDFPSMFRQALAIEIADRRNDWTIPTEADIAQEAAKVVEALPPTPPTPPTPEADGIVFRTRIASASGTEYEVTLNDDGVWACTCPAYQFARANPCKHIQQAQVATPEPEPEPEPAPPVVSEPVVRGPAQPLPRLRNIPQPSGGLMVDGTPPERPRAAQAQDPWALPADKMPPAKGTVVPVGAKVIMGKK